ncbi:Angiopoietin-related protein 7 [Stylophora pistillata]|uniref:Angiopoietin-related protein 7 n=1 Tax=Stylophora pistillata TaxID=50429 RepID=A0A2B4RZT8_STYPI|nr:Angiopoietin-related protein 7 [Stylophora pistillata]
MLRGSALQRDIENGVILDAPRRLIDGNEVKPLLVSNSCFDLNSWLMTPYTQTPPITAAQNNFNSALSSAREKIVQAFGLLRGRWRCLLETMKEDTLRVPTTVIACCVLHNLCLEMEDDATIEPVFIHNDVDFDVEDSDDLPITSEGGKQLRETIRQYLDTYGYEQIVQLMEAHYFTSSTFQTAISDSSKTKTTLGDTLTGGKCHNVHFNNYYSGAASKDIKAHLLKIENQLAKLEKKIEALTENKTTPPVMKNCADLYKSGQRVSGVYTVDPDGSGSFDVFCDQKSAGGGWTVFQKRLDGSVDFNNRGWADFKRGFGNLNGEFWLGLDKIHRLTKTKSRLRVELEDTQGKTAYAEYDMFSVSSERNKYRLGLGNYTVKCIQSVYLSILARIVITNKHIIAILRFSTPPAFANQM